MREKPREREEEKEGGGGGGWGGLPIRRARVGYHTPDRVEREHAL